jgi:hypothetical protein
MTETGWYSGDQKPVRVGEYERKYYCSLSGHKYLRCWWDGRAFYQGVAIGVDSSAKVIYGKSISQNLPWRGVTK